MKGIALTSEGLVYLLFCILRSPVFGAQVIEKYEAEMGKAIPEASIRNIFSLIKEYYSENKSIPTIPALKLAFLGRCQQAHYEVSSLTATQQLLDALATIDVPVDLNAAREIYRLLVNNYYKNQTLMQVMSLNGDDSGFKELLDNLYQKCTNKLSINPVTISSTISDLDFLFVKEKYLSTGIEFIDHFLGGVKGQEVYVLLGPTGGGKSALGLQLCTAQAKNIYNTDPAYEDYVNVFITYEMDHAASAVRALSQVSEVPIKTLRATFSSGSVPTQDRYPVTPLERVNKAIELINKHLVILDFSGHRRENGVVYGYGGIDELAATLMTLADRKRIGTVVIDWAGACCDKYLGTISVKNFDSARIAHLSSFVTQVYDRIAAVLDCPVWVVHQLSGVASSRPPQKYAHHSDAAYCKSFANYAWAALCLGTKDPETGVFSLNASKLRNAETVPPKLVKINDCLSLQDVSNEYRMEMFGITAKNG